MKTKKCYSLLAALLATVLLLSSVLAICMASAADENIASDKAVTLKAFDTAELASHTARQFTAGTPIGIRMGFGAPFKKFTLCMPTWGDKTVSLTLSLYKWDTDFDTSRSAAPVATRKVENHPDNGHAYLEFDEQPAGEYLICIDEFSGGRLGAWQMSSAVSNAYTYENDRIKTVSHNKLFTNLKGFGFLFLVFFYFFKILFIGKTKHFFKIIEFVFHCGNLPIHLLF